MKIMSYSLIKRVKLSTLTRQLSLREKEMDEATQFIKAIESGNLEVSYLEEDRTEAENILASSLISMRNQMKQFAQEEQQRKWVTEGLAQFVDILRAKNDDINVLTDDILCHLVKYMGANQGALYVVNDDNEKDLHLEMMACYAYNRKKHLHQRIEVGEGLTGQVVLEKATIYMTDIPSNYIHITSGLGEALPNSLLLVPLKIEEKVFGVIEIASFGEIKQHQIDFVEKLGESIASTISAVKVSERTKKLLQASQQQAEMMRSQEEEMRQNMEELSATQEDMQRILQEVQEKEGYLNEVLNASKDSIFTIDTNLKVISFNKAFAFIIKAAGFELKKGDDILTITPEGNAREQQKNNYRKVLAGEHIEVTEAHDIGGVEMHFISIFSPLKNEEGQVLGAACYAKDITEIINARKEAEAAAAQSQQAAEEMKAQEEELRQNMEELSATQEEMQRILREVQEKEGYLTAVLNASKDSVFTIDSELKIISFNHSFAFIVKNLGIEIKKGDDVLSLTAEGPIRDQQKANYIKVLGGEAFEVTETHDIGGSEYHFVSIFSPLKNEQGQVYGAACYAKDVTEIVNARRDAEKAAAQAQDQEAYLNGVLNSSKDSIFTLDKEYKIISFNTTFRLTVESMGFEVKKGLDMLSILNEGTERKTQKEYYNRAFEGDYFEVVNTFNVNGVDSTFVNAYCPLTDTEGNVFALAIYAKDTSELTKAQKEVEAAYKIAHEKEVYMHHMLNATSDAILTVDRDLNVVLANNVMIKTFRAQGILMDVGFHVTELSQKGKEEDFMAPYKAAFEGKTVEVTREYFDHTYLITYNPLLDDEGKITGASLFTKDITESVRLQKQTEQLLEQAQQQAEELRAQEEEIRQNMEELSATQEEIQRHMKEVEDVKKELEVRESVFGYTTILSESDAKGNILYVNKKLCEVSKYSKEELIGQPHNIFRHPDMPKELFKLLWEKIKKGEVFQAVIKNKAKDGSHYWVDATIVPVKDEKGAILKHVGSRYHIVREEMAVQLYNAQALRLGLPSLPISSMSVA